MINVLFSCTFGSSSSEKTPATETVAIETELPLDTKELDLTQQEPWQQLNGRWFRMKEKNGRYAIEFPCEGDDKVLVFSKRGTEPYFSVLEGLEVPLEEAVQSVQTQEGVYILDAKNGSEHQFYLEADTLQFNNELYLAERAKSTIEQVYLTDPSCGTPKDFSLANTEGKFLLGTWKTKECNRSYLRISEGQFDFTQDADDIIAFTKEKEGVYWLTLRANKLRHGVRIERKEEKITVWTGQFPSWSPIEFIPEKSCAGKKP